MENYNDKVNEIMESLADFCNCYDMSYCDYYDDYAIIIEKALKLYFKGQSN